MCQKERKNMTEEERKAVMANLANSLTYEKIKEEDAIESFLFGNVPLLLYGAQPCSGKSEKIMHYDVGCEKIYVRTATLNSIDCVNIYNERGYMQEAKPSWYVNLKRKCENETEQIHILLLEDLDEVSKEVENAILDNIFKGKCYLPSNARVVATSRKPLSSRSWFSFYGRCFSYTAYLGNGFSHLVFVQ